MGPSDAGGADGADASACDGPCCGATACAAPAMCLEGTCCPPMSYQADVAPWFALRCSGCHDWTAASLVTRSPMGEKCGPGGAGANYRSTWRLVAPGDLANSVLWWFVKDCCAPACGAFCGPDCLSPPCSNAISKCGSSNPLCLLQHRTTDQERARIQCWILEGAPNN